MSRPRPALPALLLTLATCGGPTDAAYSARPAFDALQSALE
jgi:hypothetical protein